MSKVPDPGGGDNEHTSSNLSSALPATSTWGEGRESTKSDVVKMRSF